jgi:transcriptional regulator with XRE-family HTH domain
MPKSVFTDEYASVIEVLVRARRRATVSQVELARRLGKPQQFVSRVERSERRLDIVEFYAFARALEIDPTDLFAEATARLPHKVAI